MLNSLISSKTKRQILKQFLSNPEEKYYLRQLSVILKISVGTLHRELNRLEKSGILVSEPLGNLRFFSANKSFPVFQELKQIIFKTEGIKGTLEQVLKEVKGIKAALIYGSFARQEEKAHSDIDVFLLGDISEDKLITKISELENQFQREINYTIYSLAEFKKKKKAKNSFILEVLRGPKLFLVGTQEELDAIR